jgi:hypothetical protein
VVKLNKFGLNRRSTPVLHNQAVEAKHHAGMAFNLAGLVNVGDMSVKCVHSGIRRPQQRLR